MAQIPESIGKYKVQSLIARGGMGEVFKADHPTLKRPVVIKRLTMRGNPGVVERFRREAQIMIDFKSEYIVDVFDHFREGNWYHIVQEYIDGISLDKLIERERYLPEYIALPIFLAACRALYYAHARGVVHRDIKPGNILISRSGQVKLVDFGIASVRGGEGEEALTQEGMTLGTPSYMAPEQFHSSRDVDARADIYSLGVLLYECVTGKKPFPGSFTPETLQLIQRGKYPAASRVNPRVGGFLNRLIRKAMFARKNRRFKTLSAMIRRVEQYLGTKESYEHPHEYAPLIASFLAEENPLPNQRPASITKLVVVSLLVVGFLGLISMFLYRGYHQALFSPQSYGGVSVTIRIPQSYELPGSLPGTIQGSLIPLSIGQFTESSADAGSTGPEPRVLHLGGRAAASGQLEYAAPLQFLSTGDYTLEVGVGEGLLVRSIRVLPRSIAGWNQVVSFQLPSPEPASLEVIPRIRDARTGIILTRDARVAVTSGGQSGQDLGVRVQLQGYYSTTITVPTRIGQRQVIIDAALEPRPGSVEVTWNPAPGARDQGTGNMHSDGSPAGTGTTQGGSGELVQSSDSNPDEFQGNQSQRPRQLLLNGSERYLEGGRDPELRSLPRLKPGESSTIVLAPGTYTLGYREGNRLWEQGFTLVSTEITRIQLGSPR
jgi:serine/threonine-protein kinase